MNSQRVRSDAYLKDLFMPVPDVESRSFPFSITDSNVFLPQSGNIFYVISSFQSCESYFMI